MSVGYGAAYDVSSPGGASPPPTPVPSPTLNATISALGFSRSFNILYQSADLNYGAGDPAEGFRAGVAIRLRGLGGGDCFMVGNYNDATPAGWAIGSTQFGITKVDQVFGFFCYLRDASGGAILANVYVRASDHLDRTMLLGFDYSGEIGGRTLTPWVNGAACGDPVVGADAYNPAAEGLAIGAQASTAWAGSQHDIIGAYFSNLPVRQDDMWRTFRRTGLLSADTSSFDVQAVYNTRTLVGATPGNIPWPLTWTNEGSDGAAGNLTHSIDPPVDNADVEYDTNPAFSGVTTTDI